MNRFRPLSLPRRLPMPVLALSLVPGLLLGAFFMRWNAPRTSRLEWLGGSTLYQADLSINGHDTRLTLMGFERSSDEVARDLEVDRWRPGASPAPGLWFELPATGSRRQDLMLLPGTHPRQCTAWLIEGLPAQDRPESTVNGSPCAFYPSARIWFEGFNRRSRTRFVMARTVDAPGTVRLGVSARLSGDGWQPVSPGTGGALELFTRGDKSCIVYVTRPADAAETILSVLQQE